MALAHILKPLALLRDPLITFVIAILLIATLFTIIVLLTIFDIKTPFPDLNPYIRFAYSCFLKPHRGDRSGSQQDALESFYAAQADAYDATRQRLLQGREEMLGLVAGQVKLRMSRHVGEGVVLSAKPVWVDLGGGTGYNVEKMAQYVPVSEFFAAVFIVDLSPSLCAVARRRFERLGWKNVHVVTKDVRKFRLADYYPFASAAGNQSECDRTSEELKHTKGGSDNAQLVTMSYALSMMPDFYSVVDSVSTLLAPNGVLGVADFYVQSQVEYSGRNWTGGVLGRHCTWLSRVFWRTWFEIDRVNLDPARRDYLEYRFGTILNVNSRARLLGMKIPYYIWIGCVKGAGLDTGKLQEVDAAVTESPFISALDLETKKLHQRSNSNELRSKAYESAVVNLAANIPLPASFYQNHHWRIFYDDRLQKHRQFNDQYIYAFTWEDSRVDQRILKVGSDDVILAITSAGDNILDFVLQRPKRVHAVDLNPAQNHLLELKLAAYTALPYSDFWKLFGKGVHPNFQKLLITHLSPHLSSLAFQYWLRHGSRTFSGRGLYRTGGSGHALALLDRLARIFGLTSEIEKLVEAETLAEQREIWSRSLRKVLLSHLLSWAVIGNASWMWKALGVPRTQRALIEADYHDGPLDAYTTLSGPVSAKSAINVPPIGARPAGSSTAIWRYVVDTLDPVVRDTLLSGDNHYYGLCLRGRYSRKCHPSYLTPRAHMQLARAGIFDGLRIHTDELNEVVKRMQPETLTIAVLMDSMDWFEMGDRERARAQVVDVNRALKVRGRVLIRSASRKPWYLGVFEECGFENRRVAVRMPGDCVDRVNMYASTWVCTKMENLPQSIGSGEKLGKRTSFEELKL